MLVIIFVVLSGPVHDALYLSQVLFVGEAAFGVAWDVDAGDALELSIQHGHVHSEINWHDPGAGRLKEVGVRRLKEAVMKRLVDVPLGGQWLRQDTNDRLVVLGSNVVARVHHDWLSLVAAQVPGTMAI